ncbi:MAG TPA: cysteine peptidase family C39 domain-containing protein [Candidatus Rifleibacterium sp.]|nr:cysteine peptidase family C39 domain-containing protein [Candidatus Rifleibacterium sp.]HPT45774.1 cysteine peptidase family C39 domain-containing protein [Candidatus Rifleibacterium sp.]
MYIEFWLKAVAGIIAAFFVVLHARSRVRDASVAQQSAFERLRLPVILAVAFFAGCLLLSRNGFIVRAMEFDPAMPVWVIICFLKLLLLGYLAHKAVACSDDYFRKAHHLLVGVIFIGVGLLELILILPAAPLVGPETYDLNGVTMQTLQVTCVPSALATICCLYGEPITEYEAVRRVKTLFIGSLTGHSVAGCRNLGFTEAAYSPKSLTEVLEENLPFIITINAGFSNVEHAIGVIGSVEEKIFLADPLRGLVTVPLRDLKQHWQGSIIRLGHRAGYARVPFLREFKTETLKQNRFRLK